MRVVQLNMPAKNIHDFHKRPWKIDEAEEIIEKQDKRKQGFGAFLKKMEAERAEHLMLSRFPWNEGDMDGLCGRADSLAVSYTHLTLPTRDLV